MQKLINEVEVYKVTNNNKIKKVKTLNVSIKEHGYFRTFFKAKKSLLKDIENDIKFHQSWIKEHQKDVDKEVNQLNEALKLKKEILNLRGE